MSKGYVYILANTIIRKGVLASILALAAFLTARSETETIDGYKWIYEIVGNNAVVIPYNGSLSCAVSPEPIGDLTIPSVLGGHPVAGIDRYAFYNCTELTSVTIPSSVTSIGDLAFSCCSGMTNVTLSSSLTNIGQWAFSGCSGLISVTIPSSVTSIGDCAFYGCSGMIAYSVDEDNPDFKSENGLLLTKDGSKLLAGVNGDVVIPSSVTSIGSYAFRGCSGLTSVKIPSSVTSFGDYAFERCSGVREATVPGWKCRIDFTSVTNLVISEGTTNIADSAFSGCSGLISVTIPSSVTSIGRGAFRNCSGLISFFVDEDNPNFKAENGLLLTKDGQRIVAGVNGDVVIPSSVTSIADDAFYGCSGLTSVTIPSSVTSIGDCAFYGCSGLTSVTIPEGVVNIGNYVFRNCTGLTSVTIPSSVTSIGYEAFLDCSGLTSVTISAGVTDIPEGAFAGCGGLTSLTIPSSVTSIGRYAFTGCYMLTNVTLEGDAPAVGDNVFDMIPSGLVVHVKKGSSGWTQWCGRELRFDADGGTASSTVNMNLTITNVHVHYIQTSELSPMAAPVTKDVGIVNVMTEIKGGNVSIPESWVTNYPTFKATFGEDFASALVKTTGKVGAGGSPLFVWQDYVAGTDPTDENDVFRASVTMVEGKPVISYTPELSEVEKAKRKYVTWGKVKLQDEKWVEVPKGNEDDYNFFKVTVEMR